MNGKVIDVKKDDGSSGAEVIMFERKSTVCPNQIWYEDENAVIRSKLNGYVLDASGNSTLSDIHRVLVLFQSTHF